MTEKDRSTLEARIVASILEYPPSERPGIAMHYACALFADWPADYNEQDVASALQWFGDKVLNALPEEDRQNFLASNNDETSRETIGEIARTEWLNGKPEFLEMMILCGNPLSPNTRAFVAGIVAGKQKRPHRNRKPARILALAKYEDIKTAMLAREALDTEKQLIRRREPNQTDVDRTAKENLAEALGIGRGTFESLLNPYTNVTPRKSKKSSG